MHAIFVTCKCTHPNTSASIHTQTREEEQKKKKKDHLYTNKKRIGKIATKVQES